MSNELYHFGVKGMHWGVRRYQNKDGSLTARGRKKYLLEDGSLSPKGEKRVAKLNKYRNRMAAQAITKSGRYRDASKDHEVALYDLNTRGKNSKPFERARNNYLETHKTSSKYMNAYNEWSFDKHVSDKMLKEVIDVESKEVARTKKNAKQYIANNKNLMNTTVSITTTKKELRRKREKGIDYMINDTYYYKNDSYI